MSRRRRILLAVIAMALVAGIWFACSRREPVQEGKTFSQWFAEILRI
jgi:hypothetical protein